MQHPELLQGAQVVLGQPQAVQALEALAHTWQTQQRGARPVNLKKQLRGSKMSTCLGLDGFVVKRGTCRMSGMARSAMRSTVTNLKSSSVTLPHSLGCSRHSHDSP